MKNLMNFIKNKLRKKFKELNPGHKKTPKNFLRGFCGPRWTRTTDPLIMSKGDYLEYQLSYGPVF